MIDPSNYLELEEHLAEKESLFEREVRIASEHPQENPMEFLDPDDPLYQIMIKNQVNGNSILGGS